jgi:hypothetical protein
MNLAWHDVIAKTWVSVQIDIAKMLNVNLQEHLGLSPVQLVFLGVTWVFLVKYCRLDAAVLLRGYRQEEVAPYNKEHILVGLPKRPIRRMIDE